MNKFKSFCKNFVNKIMASPRKKYYEKMQKRLVNKTPTIICNDCAGGVIYHNLNLRFYSPTINLYFEKNDFVKFVNNLKDFLNCELQEVKDLSKKFPVGKLTVGDETVIVNFMHYETFDVAKQKWEERKKRVDFDNIFIIQTIAKNVSKQDIDDFCKIKFKNKILITCDEQYAADNIITNKVFNKKYFHGKLLNYKTPFSTKRYLDDFDYVSFLNSKN